VKRQDRVVMSALWAAWGDALGFMTELASPGVVEARTGGSVVSTTIPWKRRIGGRTPVTVSLPAGSYSDDTQLRLSTSRAIRSDGRFDVEAFAKVELPVFLNYALGAGRGTKAAAAALSRAGVSWSTNFFKTDGQSYVNGGGNGAAMRIQPHVWASRSPGSWESWMPDVIRNTLTTHGHPRGIAGAVIHASILAQTFDNEEIPHPEEWIGGVELFDAVVQSIARDDELSSLWLPTWEREAGTSFTAAMREMVGGYAAQLKVLREGPVELEDWRETVGRLGGLDIATRGAGDISAVLAGVLAWVARDDPARGLIVAANVLGSDTDTIATMAGAIIGAVHDGLPPGPVQDDEFIGREANRLGSLGINPPKRHFRYPDLLTWSVPRAAVDLVGMVDGRLALMGLGYLDAEPIAASRAAGTPTNWRWARLPFNQHVLVRHRDSPNELKPTLLPGRPLAARRTIEQDQQESFFGDIDIDSESRPESKSAGRGGDEEAATKRNASRNEPMHGESATGDTTQLHSRIRSLLPTASAESCQVVATFLDIRGFSSFAAQAESFDAALYLRSLYTAILDSYFPDADFFKPTGDGLFLVHELASQASSVPPKVSSVLARCVRLVENFGQITADDLMVNFAVPQYLGVGVARGSVTRLVSGDTVLDYTGRSLNLASRLMDKARPRGVVFADSHAAQLMEPKVASLFSNDRVCIRGISDQDPIGICITREVQIAPEDRYPPPSSKNQWGSMHSLSVDDVRRLSSYAFYLPRVPRVDERAGVHVEVPTFDKEGRPDGSVHSMRIYGRVDEHPEGAVVTIPLASVRNSLKGIPAMTTSRILGLTKTTYVSFTPFCGPIDEG